MLNRTDRGREKIRTSVIGFAIHRLATRPLDLISNLSLLDCISF